MIHEFCRHEGNDVICRKGLRPICEAGRPNIPGNTALVKPFLCRDEVRVCMAFTTEDKKSCPNGEVITVNIVRP